MAIHSTIVTGSRLVERALYGQPMDFATLIAPFDVREFETEYWNRKPLVIRGAADDERATLVDWPRLNALLQIRPHWTADRMKLVLDSRPIDPDFYMEDIAGRRLASPAQVEIMLAVGASLVADMVEEIDPNIARLTAMLADRFGARSGANIYASFQDVQAFASHCDTHEVFAIQCAGAKRWRVYRNRADNPLEGLTGEGAQARIDAAKGPVLMDVTLQAGDLIYIPRGFFHDAVATDTSSLHLTISVAPASGALLFNFLEELARAESGFRGYLPDARLDDGAALQAALGRLGARLSELSSSRGMHERVAQWQRRFHRPVRYPSLPDRPKPGQLARTQHRADLVENAEGAVIVTASGTSEHVGVLSDAAGYILYRPAVLREEIHARFDHHPKPELDALLDRMVKAGLLTPG